MKTYSEKLRDPRWQRKRLEVMERDSFKCTQCGDKKSTLNIHHWKYTKNPWDAPNSDLSTVCESCHKEIEESKSFVSTYIKNKWFRSILDTLNVMFKVNKPMEARYKDGKLEVRYKDDVLTQFDNLIDLNSLDYCEGFTLNSPFVFHKGVFVQYKNERVLSWIDEIDENHRENLLAAAFWKGSISLAWKNKIPDEYQSEKYIEPKDGDSWYINASTLIK